MSRRQELLGLATFLITRGLPIISLTDVVFIDDIRFKISDHVSMPCHIDISRNADAGRQLRRQFSILIHHYAASCRSKHIYLPGD